MVLGFEAWILDSKVVLLTVMLVWPLLASWSVSVTCSHKDAESQASLSLGSTCQKTFVSELMAWPGCSVRSARLSGTPRDSGVVSHWPGGSAHLVWALSRVWWLWKQKVQHLNIFKSFAFFFSSGVSFIGCMTCVIFVPLHLCCL